MHQGERISCATQPHGFVKARLASPHDVGPGPEVRGLLQVNAGGERKLMRHGRYDTRAPLRGLSISALPPSEKQGRFVIQLALLDDIWGGHLMKFHINRKVASEMHSELRPSCSGYFSKMHQSASGLNALGVMR